MKLELKHLAGYLPYRLKIKTYYGWDTMSTLSEDCVNTDHENYYYYNCSGIDSFKPILRPLLDLTKEIEVNGEEFVPMNWYYNKNAFKDSFLEMQDHIKDMLKLETCPQCIFQKLLEWHFDIYGLIDAGLAIDINTLNK
jgi:hypothetical protein